MKGISRQFLLAMASSWVCLFWGAGHAGCNSSHIEERTDEAILDRDFKIKYGQELTVKGEDLKVKFVSLLDDSRCPANVTCIWEGDAHIQIGVRRANAEESKMELHTNARFNQAGKYQRYVIRLVALDPYPGTEAGKERSDYIATIRINKE